MVPVCDRIWFPSTSLEASTIGDSRMRQVSSQSATMSLAGPSPDRARAWSPWPTEPCHQWPSWSQPRYSAQGSNDSGGSELGNVGCGIHDSVNPY